MSATIDRATLAEWIERGAAFDLVDTLPAGPYARHHLPGAIHIVSDDIKAEAPRRLPDRDRTVVVYCGSAACQRSAKAAARIDRLGYRDVREYIDGRRDWEAAGLPLQTGTDPGAPA
ncbi:MAG: rhodanese-like domain-containing protein [Halofilum sp. (in: g-proteobacteria)]